MRVRLPSFIIVTLVSLTLHPVRPNLLKNNPATQIHSRSLAAEVKVRKYEENEIKDYYNMIGQDGKSKTDNGVTPLMNEETYFSTHLRYLKCHHHVKYMKLNVNCLPADEETLILPRDKYVFTVESNFKKFFLRIDDSPIRYELALEHTMKKTGKILRLLKHKVIKSRFAGIYKFEKNWGVLDYAIMTKMLNPYDKYNYMYQLVRLASQTLKSRDKRNMALNINFSPANILLTKSAKYSIKLITPLHTNLRETIYSSIPEKKGEFEFIDKQKYHVYYLGKLFYFMIFRVFPTSNHSTFLLKLNRFIEDQQDRTRSDKFASTSVKEFMDDFIEDTNSKYHGKTGEDFQTDEEDLKFQREISKNTDMRLIILIRMMMNANPLDRPTLTTVQDTIFQIKNRQMFFVEHVRHFFISIWERMVSELGMEIYEAESLNFEISRLKQERNNKLAIVKFESDPKIDSINHEPMILKKSDPAVRNMKQKAPNHISQISFLLIQKIINYINPNDEYGMYNSTIFEDTLDESFLIPIKLKLGKKLNSSCPDTRDLDQIELQIIRQANGNYDKYKEEIQSIYHVKMAQTASKNARLIVAGFFDPEHVIPKNDHEHDHEHDLSLSFQIEYGVFIIMCLMSVLIMVLTLIRRRLKEKIYLASKFKCFIQR